MAKKQTGLFEKFKKIESELLAVLNETKTETDLSGTKQIVKSGLKQYVKKVQKARKLFDEYEVVAAEIEKIAHDEAEEVLHEHKSIADEVVGLRETHEVTTEYIDKIEATEGVVKVVKKKKNKFSAREF